MMQPKQKPIFWYRPKSDGGYEGPVHDSMLEDVRKLSGAWLPLHTAAPQPEQSANERVNAVAQQLPEALKAVLRILPGLTAYLEGRQRAQSVNANGLSKEIESWQGALDGFARWLRDALVAAPQPTNQPPAQTGQEPALLGRWHHGAGALCSGSLRIARADFDTNPPMDFQEQVFEDICNTMNERLAAYQAPSTTPVGEQDLGYAVADIDAVTLALTGDEGEDDSLTVLKRWAQHVGAVWPGKTAAQVLRELEGQHEQGSVPNPEGKKGT